MRRRHRTHQPSVGWPCTRGRAVYNAQNSFYITKRVKLIGDLWRAAPDHPQLATLMIYRWQNANKIYGLNTVSEITAFAERHPEAEEAVKTGRFHVANAAIPQLRNNPEKMETTVNDFIDAYPGDDKGAQLLSNMSRYVTDEDAALAVNRRMIAEFPDSRYAKGAKAKIRQLEGIGKPFELTFTDHISGQAISMDELRGKVVVIDFWATWCGPCVAELPHMKELYAKYHDKGVEFIGISLDQKAQTLRDYCEENDIPWPQYCEEGKVWDTEFSTNWGINSIPTLFIIDKQGELHSTKARGKLDTLIPQLLKK